jgi:hypothetical protein
VTALDDLHALWAELKLTTKGYTQMRQPLVAGHWQNATAIYEKLEAELGATPPPPPPTPPSGTVLADQRAIHMVSLPPAGDSATDQDPSGFWDGLTYKNGDIWLTTDPFYGKVYAVCCNGASSNPWYDDATSMSAELTKRKGNRAGLWDWYALVFAVATDFTPTDWGVVYQFNYPTLSSPPLAIAIDRNGIGLDRLAGRLRETSPGNGKWYVADVQDHPRFLPLASVAGKWVEVLLGVKWAFDATGAIRCSTRCKANGETAFTSRFTADNVPTWQYRDGQPKPTAGLDKQGCYQGYGSVPPSWPTNHVLHRGFMVCSDEATARANLP